MRQRGNLCDVSTPFLNLGSDRESKDGSFCGFHKAKICCHLWQEEKAQHACRREPDESGDHSVGQGGPIVEDVGERLQRLPSPAIEA